MTAILGLNAYHGDAAAALVVDGELVAAAEEERFNRVKHCAGFPALAAALVPRGRGHRARRARPRRDRRATRGRTSARSCGASRPARRASPTSGARARNAARVGGSSVRAALAAALGVPSRRCGAGPRRRAPPRARRERVPRLAVRGGGRPLARRLRRLRLDDARARPREPARGDSAACSSRTRSGSSTRRSRSGSASRTTATRGR